MKISFNYTDVKNPLYTIFRNKIDKYYQKLFAKIFTFDK